MVLGIDEFYDSLLNGFNRKGIRIYADLCGFSKFNTENPFESA
jgi:hypothetical protein